MTTEVSAPGMLRVAAIAKQYASPHGPLRVLTDVDFALVPGDAAAITGPSGSGKSTMLYILGALEPPTSGTVTLDGRNPYALGVRDLADFRNRQIGFVFQDHCLLPQLSVLENVLVPTLVASDRNSRTDAGVSADQPFARALIDQVGLTARIDHRPAALSGGERQRVAIARALIRRPRLVLCDEPTGNLDADSAAAVASLLFDLHHRHQTILIVVTHSPVLAAQLPIRFELDHGALRRMTS
jgi:lipoprotein-releasing system ATP-binding protein